MNIVEAIILGLVQGLTEFIPVSSSGHLLLLHDAFGLSETGLGFDVALHIGTLVALLVYFHRDIRRLAVAFFKKSTETKLARLLAAATVPAVVAGILLQDKAETTFRSPVLVCLTLAGVALIMIWAENWTAKRQGQKDINRVSARQALLIGSAQAIALIPGVSRSGSTITTGLFAGLDRVAATRFSFLLSIPITFGAIVKVVGDAGTTQQINNEPMLFAVGIITAFISGIFAIRYLLKFVAKHSLKAFAYYRLVLAAISLVLLASF
jgi:undecaprenyl-diphosphatase